MKNAKSAAVAEKTAPAQDTAHKSAHDHSHPHADHHAHGDEHDHGHLQAASPEAALVNIAANAARNSRRSGARCWNCC
jgi:Fur family zinc uptake transcriptional regulator